MDGGNRKGSEGLKYTLNKNEQDVLSVMRNMMNGSHRIKARPKVGFFVFFFLGFFFFFFFFFGHAHGVWKFPGQGSNPCHRSDNAKAPIHCSTRELQI